MVRSVPRCAHCGRAMSGAASATRFCSDACALAFKPPTPIVDSLTEGLNVWRKRAAAPPDSTVTHWTPAAAFHAQAQEAARRTPPLPEPGDDAGFPCPSCDGPMIVRSVIGPRNDTSIVCECPHCSVSETRRP